MTRLLAFITERRVLTKTFPFNLNKKAIKRTWTHGSEANSLTVLF